LRRLREIQRSDPAKWSKICLCEKTHAAGVATATNLEENPFEGEGEMDDDSAITVSELVAGIVSTANGSGLADHIVVAPEGHMELAEYVMVEEQRDATKMSIEDILKEVETSGRGKRALVKSRRYGDDYKGH
jgi:hypothetical protein